MAKSVNDILFRFLADTKSLEKGGKRANKSMGGVGAAAKKMGGLLAVAFGAREIINFGQDAIEASTTYTESINAVEVSTGKAAKQILALGETAATAFGLSKIEVNKAAVAFAAFGEKIDTDGNIADTFEEFIGRATDFASVMDIDVNDALVKFQSGLAGETEPLRRFGIDVSAASTKLFALENGIGAVGRELTEAEKVQARYGLLLKQTEKFAGDFANTQGEVANQTRQANAELVNAKIALGDELMPLMVEWVKFQRKVLIPTLIDVAGEFSVYSDRLSTVTDSTSALVDKSEAIGETLKDLVQRINPVFQAWTLLKGGYDLITGSTEDLDVATTGLADNIGVLGDALKDHQIRAMLAAGASRELIDALNAEIEDNGIVKWKNTVEAANRSMRDAIELRVALSGGVPAFGFVTPSGIVGAAHGGTIQPGGTALVGERGPEIISPRGGAHITPAHRSRGDGGGVVVNVEFSGVVGDPIAVAEQIQDLIELYGRTNSAF